MIPSTADLHRRRGEKPKRSYSKPYDPDPSKHIYLSAAGGCARKETFRLLGYDAERASGQMNKRWDDGKFWGDYVALLWQAAASEGELLQVEREYVLETPFGVGFIDMLAWVNPTDIGLNRAAHIVEVKTATSDGAQWLPKQENIDQALLYWHFLNDLLNVRQSPALYDITLEVAYVLMDTREVISYPIEPDPGRIARLLQWLTNVQEAVQEGEPLLRDPQYKPDKFPCGWPKAKVPGKCAYFKHCYGDDHA